MRSRYAAFVKRDVPYLHRTLHPSHDDGEVAFVRFEASMKKHFASGVVYQALSVLGTAPEDEDGVSKVLFVARLAQRGKDRSFAEVSSFARVNGEIRYLTGITMPIADVQGLSGETAVREAEARHAARARTPRG